MQIKPALSAVIALLMGALRSILPEVIRCPRLIGFPQSVTAPVGYRGVQAKPQINEPPVASGGAMHSEVATSSLDGPVLDAIGLISPEVSGLPANLWGIGLSEEIAASITRNRAESLPALQQLFLTMLLAQSHPPIDHGNRGILLKARIDKLMALGALEQAHAVLEIAGPVNAELFRRTFDVAILTGDENNACQDIEKAPGLAPTLQTRVFCLARGGDWDAAALTLATSRALGHVNRDQGALLARFLDPDLFEEDPVPPAPSL